MAKFYLFISDMGSVRIVYDGINKNYRSMTDGAVITDPSVLIYEINRITKECNDIHETAEFFTCTDNEHEWLFYDAGENGWAKFFFENVSGDWRQLSGPVMWATLKDLLWDINLVGDYDYDRI